MALLDLQQNDEVLPIAERLVEERVPFALLASHELPRPRHPALMGVPLLQKPCTLPKLGMSLRLLYRLDLTLGLARLDRLIGRARDCVARQVKVVNRLNRVDGDVEMASGLLHSYEHALALFEARRQKMVVELARQGGAVAL